MSNDIDPDKTMRIRKLIDDEGYTHEQAQMIVDYGEDLHTPPTHEDREVGADSCRPNDDGFSDDGFSDDHIPFGRSVCQTCDGKGFV